MSTLTRVIQHRLPWFLRRGRACVHLDQVQAVTPSSDGCEECLKIGDTWVHLRLCVTCGKVGCCDNSRNRHASAHFHSAGHPIVRSYQPGEDWLWCYVDEQLLRFDALRPPSRPPRQVA